MKKSIIKVLSVVLAVVTALTSAPLSGFIGLELPEWLNFSIISKAEETATSGTCGENVTWNFDESTGTLTISGTGAMINYDYDNRPWESYEDSIKTVVIEDGVTTIGDSAFEDCTGITNITIPDSITSISNLAFSYCDSLTSVAIPDSVTTIGELAFCGCDSLTSVIIGNDVALIGNGAFSGCDSLTSITIPDSVTTIGEYAFSSCSSLTSVIIPNSVTSISDGAYECCDNLTSVTIPDSVTKIGEDAFYNCTSLTSITIPDSVTAIGEDAFSGCFSLTSVTIGDSVTTIGNCAFSGCSSLTSVTIPNSVETIDREAFYGCSSLTCITIPDSVTTIGHEAFRNCISLTSVTIPDSVTAIGDIVFSNCKSLTSIAIPDSVTKIGEWAFYNCTSLTSITIPYSVTKIGEWAFYNCTSLTDVYYNGTEEQWNDISFCWYNERLTNATIHYNNTNNTTIKISKDYEQQAKGTSFSVSASFSSDTYSPSTVTYTIEGESNGLIVDGGLSWIESELDENLNIISYSISLSLKAIKTGTYTVKFTAPDGASDSIVIIVNEVSSIENGTIVGVLKSYEELIVVIQDDQEGNLGEHYNTVSSITVDGFKYNVTDYKKISLSHIESLKNKEVVFNISNGCVTNIIGFDEDNFKATISIDSFDVEYKDGIRRKKVHEFSYRIYNSIVNIYNDDYVDAIAKYCQENNKYCLQNISVTFTLPNMDVLYFKDGMFGKKAEITFPLDGEIVYPNSFYDSICKIRAQKEHGFNGNETFGLELWGTVNGDINGSHVSNVVNSFTANLSNTVTHKNPKPEEIEWEEITIYEFLEIIHDDVVRCDALDSTERALLSNEITKVLALNDFTEFDDVLGTIEVAWDMSGDFYGVKFKTAESVGKVYLEALVGEICSEMNVQCT